MYGGGGVLVLWYSGGTIVEKRLSFAERTYPYDWH